MKKKKMKLVQGQRLTSSVKWEADNLKVFLYSSSISFFEDFYLNMVHNMDPILVNKC
jgi:hypothetical protein